MIVYLNTCCHREPVLTLVWRSPKATQPTRGLPRQFANWLAMTPCFYCAKRSFIAIIPFQRPMGVKNRPRYSRDGARRAVFRYTKTVWPFSQNRTCRDRFTNRDTLLPDIPKKAGRRPQLATSMLLPLYKPCLIVYNGSDGC